MLNNSPITATQKWLVSFVIAHNICPFASHVHDSGSIRYETVVSRNMEDSLQALMAECRYLDAHPATATTLLIFSRSWVDFDDFLDMLAIAEQLLVDQGYEGIYQLASFHPNYCFANSEPDDPGNFTNRSPYPMLHIIREKDIEKALSSYKNPELIPERNIQLLRKIGLEKLREQFAVYFLE